VIADAYLPGRLDAWSPRLPAKVTVIAELG
jgi:hypothetical protein